MMAGKLVDLEARKLGSGDAVKFKMFLACKLYNFPASKPHCARNYEI
jgi:hypothetical protein